MVPIGLNHGLDPGSEGQAGVPYLGQVGPLLLHGSLQVVRSAATAATGVAFAAGAASATAVLVGAAAIGTPTAAGFGATFPFGAAPAAAATADFLTAAASQVNGLAAARHHLLLRLGLVVGGVGLGEIFAFIRYLPKI